MTVDFLVDVGSSAIKWCQWENDTATDSCALLHRDGQYVIELSKRWSVLPKPAAVWLASVAPGEHVKRITQLCSEIWGQSANLVQTEAVGFGVVNGYSNPAQLGVDRWLAMIGARQRCVDACCIVDCGTAATVDVMSSNGEHVGGYILPREGTARRA